MNVGRYRAAEGMAIGAARFLADAPRTDLARKIASNHIGPRDPAFDLEKSALFIEGAYPFQSARIQQRPAGEELLSPHGVPAAGDRQRGTIVPRSLYSLDDISDRSRFDDARDTSAVQSGVGVIDPRRMRPWLAAERDFQWSHVYGIVESRPRDSIPTGKVLKSATLSIRKKHPWWKPRAAALPVGS